VYLGGFPRNAAVPLTIQRGKRKGVTRKFCQQGAPG
jgi:hypothetical protein